MTETRATAPTYPPGRYGRRRDGRRRILGPVLFALMIAAGSTLLVVKLYRQYGDPTYDAQVIRYTVADAQVTVDFTVRVPAGGSATCVLRARTYAGTEVGRLTTTVAAGRDATQADASVSVPTSARAVIGEVVRCQPPG